MIDLLLNSINFQARNKFHDFPGFPRPVILIFINDLPDVVSPTSLVALYADDCKTSRVIQHPCDRESLQDDLNNLVSWSRLII